MDLLDLGDEETKTTDDHPLAEKSSSVADNSLLARPSTNSFGQTTSNSKNAEANAALDPSSPVHITLPTFRMLVLADESLESFFDSGFANSFHLADAPLPSSTLTSPSFLNLQNAAPSQMASAIPALSPGGPGAGVVAPGKGLRGMLDNIVTDGMRVAAEVRRRMDEAQKELDRGATTRGTEDDEDEDGEDHGRDLLDGADAEAVPERQGEEGGKGASLLDKEIVSSPTKEKPEAGSGSSAASVKSQGSTGMGRDVEKSTMFER